VKHATEAGGERLGQRLSETLATEKEQGMSGSLVTSQPPVSLPRATTRVCTEVLGMRWFLLAGWIQAEIKSLDVVHSVLVELVSFISSLWGSSSVHVLVRLERDVASSNNYVQMNSIYIDHSSVQLKKNSSKLPKKVFLREKLTSLIFI